jgi:hypothetical protein
MSDARLKRDINRLVEPARPARALPEAGAVDPIPAGIGSARPVIRGSRAATGGGIASPLTELSRTHHAAQSISSDGLFAWRVPHLLNMEDALGQEVQIILAPPP